MSNSSSRKDSHKNRKIVYIISCFILNSLLSVSCKNETYKGSGQEFTLISWNCQDFNLSPDTLKAAAGKLESYHPDLICLQERPHTNLLAYDTIRHTFPSYPYKVTNGREDENLNIAIFSKYPLTHVKTWYFKDTYNKMIQADVHLNGFTFRLFNVHLQTFTHRNPFYNCRQRYRQSNLLKKEIAASPYPVLICGDFNDLPLSYTLLNLLTLTQDLSQSWEGSFQELGGILKIDHILGTSPFGRSNYELIPNKWSDHKIQKAIIHYGL